MKCYRSRNKKKNHKKKQIVTLEICRSIRRYLEMERSLKEISALTDLSYNSILIHGLDDNAIVKTKMGSQR